MAARTSGSIEAEESEEIADVVEKDLALCRD